LSESEQSESQEMQELISALDLGSARGGRRLAKPLSIEVVRELTEEDLPTLLAPAPIGAPTGALAKLHHSHHQLAQLIARGVETTEVSLITGYSISYISRLSNEDPAFGELVSHYSSEREAVFVDVLERMRALGLSTLDEIQERLAESPELWSRRELMELAELLLLKPQMRGVSNGGAPAASVSVNVKFVTAPEQGESRTSLDAVDVRFEDLVE